MSRKFSRTTLSKDDAKQRQDQMKQLKPIKSRYSTLTLPLLVGLVSLSAAKTVLSLTSHEHQQQPITQQQLFNSRYNSEPSKQQQQQHQHNHPNQQQASSLAHLIQQQQRQHFRPQVADEGQSYWTHDVTLSSPTLLGQASANAQHQTGGLALMEPPRLRPQQADISFQAFQDLNSQPTSPSINRQLVLPPQFYDLGLSQVAALQLESFGAGEEASPAAKSQAPSGQVDRSRNGTARSLESQPAEAQRQTNEEQTKPMTTSETGARNSNGEPDKAAGAQPNEGAAEPTTPLAVDKTIEPRQRRRLFNRILKKAEWNHLFVELSKVFLRYFLDLALKDIIGKQSGSVASESTTTSRKKLDAQSELTDLLKDFVKTAISNI